MARYQPPHLRNRPPVHDNRAASVAEHSLAGPSSRSYLGTAPHHAAAGPRPLVGAQRSLRDWTRPPGSASVLASPATDLRPSSRTDLHARPARGGGAEDMEFLQSVSRSGGDGAEGDALKDWGLQDRFRAYIDERLDKHYLAFPGPRDRPPPGGATDQVESLSSIVLLFRKLREGVIASHRIDTFAVEVFEASARTAILAKNTAQVISALNGLVPGLYQAVDERGAGAGQSDESPDVGHEGDGLTDGMAKLHLDTKHGRDHRGLFASLLLLVHLCHSDSVTQYSSTLLDLTRPSSRPLRSPLAEVLGNGTLLMSHVGAPQSTRLLAPDDPALRVSRSVRQALSIERFDPLAFWRKAHDPSVSSIERAVLVWITDKVRDRAWEVMRRAYLEVSLDWARCTLGFGSAERAGQGETEVERWIIARGGTIIGLRVKMR